MSVDADEAVMVVEVRDRGPRFDPRSVASAPRPADATDHWELVADLAHRWGVRREDEQTVAWFAIDRPQRPRPLPAAPVDPR